MRSGTAREGADPGYPGLKASSGQILWMLFGSPRKERRLRLMTDTSLVSRTPSVGSMVPTDPFRSFERFLSQDLFPSFGLMSRFFSEPVSKAFWSPVVSGTESSPSRFPRWSRRGLAGSPSADHPSLRQPRLPSGGALILQAALAVERNRASACSGILGRFVPADPGVLGTSIPGATSFCRTPRLEELQQTARADRADCLPVEVEVVQPGGVEPPTYRSVVCRSIQLSYGCTRTAYRRAREGNCRGGRAGAQPPF